MGNRPKIWVDEKRYIYREDYNFYKMLSERKKENLSDEEIYKKCFKYSHDCGSIQRGDIIKIDFYHKYYDFSTSWFEVLRIDYGLNDMPEILLVRPETSNWSHAIPVKIVGDRCDKVIMKREK